METKVRTPEHEDSLWWLVAPLAVWIAHFIALYAMAAVWCAKVVGRAGSLELPRVVGGAITALALLVVVWMGARSVRRHRGHGLRPGERRPPFDGPTAGDRYRFLGFATLLLSILSGIAILYDALPLVFMTTCR